VRARVSLGPVSHGTTRPPITLWFLLARSEPRAPARMAGPVAAIAVLLTPLTDQPVLWTGILMASLVAFQCLPATGSSSR